MAANSNNEELAPLQVSIIKREPSPEPAASGFEIPEIKVSDCEPKSQKLYQTSTIESIEDAMAAKEDNLDIHGSYASSDSSSASPEPVRKHEVSSEDRPPVVPPPEIIEQACIIKPGVTEKQRQQSLKLKALCKEKRQAVDKPPTVYQDYDYPPPPKLASEIVQPSFSESPTKELEKSGGYVSPKRDLSPNNSDGHVSPNRDLSPNNRSTGDNDVKPEGPVSSSVAHMKTIGRSRQRLARDKDNLTPSPSPSPRRVRKFGGGSRVTELQEEGKNAIDSPSSPTLPDLPPQDYILEELEERSMIQPASYEDPKLKELMKVLIEWINDELADQRIIVKDIEEDLYDGQILQKLLEKLTGVKLDVVEVTQSEEGQKQKLKTVLEHVHRVLGLAKWNSQKWNVDSIHSKNVVAILHLLVALARHFRAPYRLPENVIVNVVVVQKRDGMLHTRTVAEELTSTYDDLGLRVERDAFDTLFDHAPDKLQVVKKSLITFVNKHLNKINLEVTDLDTQFHDGVYLTLLMGLLEDYFVPLYNFNLTPTSFEQKVHNVAFAFELMHDASLPKPKARPEDIVNLDLKSTLRVLYNVFNKYKNLS